MIRSTIIGIFLGFLCAIGLGVWAAASHRETPVVPAPITPVNVKTAQAIMMVIPDILSAVGHMRAIQSTDLSFQVGGQISQIYIQKGRVAEGDLLMQLNDDTDQAQLKSDQASLALNQSTYDRFLKLSQMGDESAQILEEKKEALLTAQAAVDKDKAILAQKQLRAPFKGVLGTMDFTVGSYIAAGAPVIHLVQLAPLKARYTVAASFKSAIEMGQSVVLTTEDYPNQNFKGIVSYIDPSVNMQSGTISIEATVQNPDFLLSPGMFVEVEQVLNPNRQLLMIPDIALMTDVQGRYVFVVQKTQVKKQYVDVSLIHQGLAAINKGLNVEDVVVTAGQQRLYDGYPVAIIGTTPVSFTPVVVAVASAANSRHG